MSAELTPHQRYEITVAQILGRPDLEFTIEATYDRTRRGGLTKCFLKDDGEELQVHERCLRAAIAAEGAAIRRIGDRSK